MYFGYGHTKDFLQLNHDDIHGSIGHRKMFPPERISTPAGLARILVDFSMLTMLVGDLGPPVSCAGSTSIYYSLNYLTYIASRNLR